MKSCQTGNCPTKLEPTHQQDPNELEWAGASQLLGQLGQEVATIHGGPPVVVQPAAASPFSVIGAGLGAAAGFGLSRVVTLPVPPVVSVLGMAVLGGLIL